MVYSVVPKWLCEGQDPWFTRTFGVSAFHLLTSSKVVRMQGFLVILAPDQANTLSYYVYQVPFKGFEATPEVLLSSLTSCTHLRRSEGKGL